MDLQKDSRGLVNFVQLMLGKPLPDAWRQLLGSTWRCVDVSHRCFDEHWRLFFYNEKTKTSAWGAERLFLSLSGAVEVEPSAPVRSSTPGRRLPALRGETCAVSKGPVQVAPSPGAIEREVKRCRELAEERMS